MRKKVIIPLLSFVIFLGAISPGFDLCCFIPTYIKTIQDFLNHHQDQGMSLVEYVDHINTDKEHTGKACNQEALKCSFCTQVHILIINEFNSHAISCRVSPIEKTELGYQSNYSSLFSKYIFQPPRV
ncbi:hypothetical protein [Solitalea lacus]|uniref:hypothetical protein n=1 Tax=Solitalea lacus TaxID=2911172 RepID=UPI001EDB531C|nr:hypothetical protein [Solitalea lacus]UKJ08756.1 hypothetical protein L2B55_06220 [Solitalea lacus]